MVELEEDVDARPLAFDCITDGVLDAEGLDDDGSGGSFVDSNSMTTTFPHVGAPLAFADADDAVFVAKMVTDSTTLSNPSKSLPPD